GTLYRRSSAGRSPQAPSFSRRPASPHSALSASSESGDGSEDM
ncbi:MAG: hypothetical protein AVDCRST_MAG01-01-3504, partial [uncultured Rubrobacteraceae bacterium]